MSSCRRASIRLTACLLSAALPSGALATAGTAATATKRPPIPRFLLRSPELWATIDVCNTAKQSDTIGVRGSMPGDGHAHDKMYMRFHLERLTAVNQWAEEAKSGYLLVGSAASGLQIGVSFTPTKPKGTWRGVVDFKWMHGKTVVLTGSAPTSASHDPKLGAEPKGYSAANCTIV